MRNKLLFLLTLAFLFAGNVYSQHSMMVVPSFHNQNEYKLYEVISAGDRNETTVLDDQFSDNQIKEVGCSYLRHQLKEAEQLHQYTEDNRPAWFYLEVSEKKQKNVSPRGTLIPCLSFDDEAVVIKSITLYVPDDLVGVYDAVPVKKNETETEAVLTVETSFGELVSLGLASNTDDSGPEIVTLGKRTREELAKRASAFAKKTVDVATSIKDKISKHPSESGQNTGQTSDQPERRDNGGEGPDKPSGKKANLARSVRPGHPVLSSWLQKLLAALKFGGRTVVNVYIPGGSFFLHQQPWTTTLIFETYKAGMISANLAYVNVYQFKTLASQSSEKLPSSDANSYVMTILSILNAPYRYASISFSKVFSLFGYFDQKLEEWVLERKRIKEQQQQQQEELEKNRQEKQRLAKERLAAFERMKIAGQLEELTEIERDPETGKVSNIYFSLKEFKKYYHRDAFVERGDDEYQKIYKERYAFYKRHIQWAQYKEKIDPEYYKERGQQERDRDWIVFNPMTVEKKGMLTFQQMTGCPESKAKKMVKHDFDRFSKKMTEEERLSHQQGKVSYMYAAGYHFALSEQETDKDKQEYHKKYVELFRKSYSHKHLENPAGLVSLTRTICSKYGK